MVKAAKMAKYLDDQTSRFASYKRNNEFTYYVEIREGFYVSSGRITSEVKADLKKFAKNVLPCFDKYDIPRLKCELLGHHLENLKSFIIELTKIRVNKVISSHYKDVYSPGMIPPPDKLTSEQELVKIDIDDKIWHELSHFPRLIFLEYAFYGLFGKLKMSL